MQNEGPRQIINEITKSRTTCQLHLSASTIEALPIFPLIEQCRSIMATEPILLHLTGNFIVVGDLHGNIDDLLQILGNFGWPPDRFYLFLGDYVDRGSNSIEVLFLLYSLKVLFPTHIYLLRGNHECKAICHKYGFYKECRGFFPTTAAYHRFCESFCDIPIAAVINDRIFCVHGGLSPTLDYLSDIEEIEKPVKDIGISPAEDLLWSDPSADCNGFEESEQRGIGFLFDREVTVNFLNDNDLTKMIRAHQFCEKGSKWNFDECLTVFSACDYCGQGNLGAVAVISESDTVTICRFKKCNPEQMAYVVQHPRWLLEMEIPEEPFVT
jgi:protein phosphatase